MKARCSIEGCSRPAKSRGWCQTHYMRWWNHKDPSEPTGCATCGAACGSATWCDQHEPTVCTCEVPVRQTGWLREHECGGCRRLLPAELCA